MSNVRINALTATAVTPNYDDYFVIDGNTYGTRNILATTALSSITGYGPMSFSGNVTVFGNVSGNEIFDIAGNSVQWNAAYSYANSTSSLNTSDFTAIATTSANWNLAYSDTQAITTLTGNWNQAYTYASTNSAYVLSDIANVASTSANWNQSYTYFTWLTANSGNNIGGTDWQSNSALVLGDLTNIASTSANWNQAFTYTNNNSGAIQTNFTNIAANSAYWNTASGGNYLALSGGSVNGLATFNNVVVLESLSALSAVYLGTTIMTSYSSLSVIDYGPGPALFVQENSSTGTIAQFNDTYGSVLYVGNRGSTAYNGLIGVNVTNPGAALTVGGTLSTNAVINDVTGTSTQWNAAYSYANTISALEASNFTNIATTSANWNLAYNDVQVITPLTGNWNQAYTYASTNSASLLYNGGALGTPASGTVTNLTVTASININGTVGATTANTGSFTSITGTGQLDVRVDTDYVAKFRSIGTYGAKVVWENIGVDDFSIEMPPNTGNLSFKASGLTQVALLNSTGLNSTAIGATTASTGAFTTLNSTSQTLLATSSGNVGIGTSSPYAKLNVENGSIIVGQNSNTTQTNTLISGYGYRIGASLIGVASIKSSYDNASNKASLEFYTDNGTTSSERMRIDSNGNVGIGTSSPAFKLDVVGGLSQLSYSTTGGPVFLLNNTSGTSIKSQVTWLSNGAPKFSMGVDPNGTGQNNFFWYDEAATAIRLILDSSGNLGLGVTPSAWGYSAMQFQDPRSVAVSGYSTGGSFGVNCYENSGFKYGGTGFAARYQINSNNGEHWWFTAPSGTAGNAISFTQAMTLDASGQLLLGTTTPVATGAGSLTVGATTGSTSTTSGALTVAGGVGIAGNLNTGTSDYSAPVVYNNSNYSYNMLGKLFLSSVGNGTAQTLATFTPSSDCTIMIKVLIRGSQVSSSNAWEDVGYASYYRSAGSYVSSTATVTNVVNISGTHTLGTLSWLNVSGSNPVLQYTQGSNGYPEETLDVYTTGRNNFGCTFSTAVVAQ